MNSGDLLVARTGATYGKTAFYESSAPAVFASYLIRLKFDRNKILPEYYWLFTQSNEYWEQAQRLVTGGAQPQFNANVIQKIQVPLISITQQEKIISEIRKDNAVIRISNETTARYEQKINELIADL